jgi:hypothetical protein
MTDTKICPQCGREYKRKYGESNYTWERRITCSLSCAGQRASNNRRLIFNETKVCPQCGCEFSRPPGVPPSNWKIRTYCSATCRNIAAGHRNRGHLTRYVEKHCECGEPTTSVVWILQGNPEGNVHAEFIEVCEDCREMWLELDDGATVERPVIEKPARRECAEPEYFAPAHVMQWRNRNGSRP